MSDRIAVMNAGKIEQVGTPMEIYSHPVSQFVAEFIGETNVFEATVKGISDKKILHLEMESGLASATMKESFSSGEYVNCSIRPDKLMFSKEPVTGFNLPGIVAEHVFDGSFEKVIIRLVNDKEIKLTRLSGEELPLAGEKIYLYWNLEDAEVMKTEGNIIYTQIEEVDLSPWNVGA